MSDKKNKMTEDEENQEVESGSADMGAQPVEARESSAELQAANEELQNKLAEAQASADEYKDGWQRSVADFQNYRKRMDAEREITYQTAVGNIIKRYLPVLDDLERALAARPQDLAWADGIELIYRKLQSILQSEGIKRIDAEGQMFDPNFHEAIGEEHADGAKSGEVIAVVRNGYMLGDKVLRPAMVRVAR